MSGYVRQSSADILPTAVIRATPVNNEFNALRDAFAQSGGHKHDGTTAEGDYVPLIADTSAKDKVVVDGTNHRIGLFINVAGTSTEQARVQNGAILPVTTNALDIGSSTYKIKDLYAAGNAYLTTGSFTGQVTSTVSTGTAPLVIASTTKVSNLNVDLLDGYDWATPAAIGTGTAAAGTFTNLTAAISLTATTAAISAGTINNTVIGGTTAQAITGTLITATTGFVGGVTGAVTGNVTGNLTGNVTGNVTGNLTGNVTASTGSSSFNDVTINGTLNMNAGTSATITNLTSPTNTNDAATKGYVDTSISNLIASAPTTLDTLNEIAAALGNDPNLSATLTTSIATKLALAGGTMSGAIAMGTNKITGLGNPTANQDAATKYYVDTQDALKLSLTGGTMSGAIAMGTSKITGLGDPTANQDAATKIYVDGILGSATSAAASAAAAATSASNAATSASNASTSASNASTSASSALTYLNTFKGQYYGSLSADPTLDPLGNAIGVGDLYWNSTANEMRVYNGSAWVAAYVPAAGYMDLTTAQTAAGVKTFSSNPILSGGTANGVTYLNGSKVLTSGSALTFDGTSLGVGTASPASKLMIGGSGANRISFGAPSGTQYVGYDGSTDIMQIASYNDIRFQVNAYNEAMRLTSTGLGIGTSSPAYKLDVNGTTRMSNGLLIQGSTLTATASQVTIDQLNTTTSRLISWGPNTTTAGILYFGNLSSNASAGSASNMVLDSSGNVGIGTSSPANKLHVVGTSQFNVGAYATGYALTLAASSETSRTYQIGMVTGGNLAIYDSGASATRLTLDSSGNLGLGVTPSAWNLGKAIEVGAIGNAIWGVQGSDLRLAANMYYNSGYKYAATGYAARYDINNGSNGGHAWFNAASGTAGNAITFTQAMTLDASGNLGVGTTSPATKLEVSGSATIARVSGTSGTAPQLQLSSSGVVNWSLRANNGGASEFTIFQDSTERARISSTGGFSVGTTADPGAGAIYATGNITAYYSSDIKFKENVRDIPDALATVNAIGGKLFDWTDEYIESKGGADGYFVQKADFGVVAQDVQKVFPIAVRTREDGSLAVDYEKLSALAMAAVSELTKRVEALEAK